MEIKLYEQHGCTALTFKRVIAKGRKDGGTPLVKTPVNVVLFPGNGSAEFFVGLPVPGINAAIADHFKMFFRDMADQTLYELHDRDGLLHIPIIFMAVVMEGNEVTIIVVNAGSRDHRTAEITADILDGSFRVTGIGFGIDIEAVFVFPVAASLYLFKRRADLSFQFIQESSTESVAQISIVEMLSLAPEAIVAVTALGNKAMDMGIPFEVPAEGMEDHEETGSEVHGFVLLKKHMGDNAVYGMEKTVKEGAVIEEKVPELFVNGKDAMAVRNINELKGHRSRAFHGILVATGRAETAVATEGDEFQFAAVRAAEHRSAEGRVAAINHLIDIFHLGFPGMEGI